MPYIRNWLRELRLAGQEQPGAACHSRSIQTHTTTTDGYGVYRLSFLPADAYTVSVTGVGDHVGSSQQVDLEQEPFPIANFTLTPRLSGTVKRWNTQHTELLAVPGAAVWVEPSGGGAVLASTTTDCEGNFNLPVTAGNYSIFARRTGNDPAGSASADVSTGNACFSFVLGPNPTAQQDNCE